MSLEAAKGVNDENVATIAYSDTGELFGLRGTTAPNLMLPRASMSAQTEHRSSWLLDTTRLPPSPTPQLA